MEKYIKNCPKCNSVQEYKTKGNYKRAIRLNTLCYHCNWEKQITHPELYVNLPNYSEHIITYKKKCPECNCEQEYKDRHKYGMAIKLNTICHNCIQNILRERKCVVCGDIFTGKIGKMRCECCDDTKYNLYTENSINKYKKEMNELQVGQTDLRMFGKDFLLENPIFLEILQVKEKVSKIVNKNYYKNK